MLSCIVAFTSFWSCSTSSCIFTLHVRFQSIYNFVVLIVSNVSSLCWSLFTIKGFFGEFFLIQIVVCGKQIINSLEPNLWFVNSGYINKINLSCTLIRFFRNWNLWTICDFLWWVLLVANWPEDKEEEIHPGFF